MSRGLEAFNLSPSERCTTTFLLVVFLSRNLFRAYDSGEETERLEVLENVGVLCGDEHDVDVVQRMVDVAHRVRLHERVLALRLNIENNLKNFNSMKLAMKDLRKRLKDNKNTISDLIYKLTQAKLKIKQLTGE